MKNVKTLKMAQMIVLSGLVSLGYGCAAPANPVAMVPDSFNVVRKHTAAVGLAVAGGKKTNPGWKSEISDADFTQALTEAIQKSGVFSSVISHENSEYRLDVTLVKLLTPNVGFDMKATAITEWKLSHRGNVISEEFISTPYTATVGDAFVGVTRLRLAVEGAARENIKEGIRRLSELEIPSTLGSSGK